MLLKDSQSKKWKKCIDKYLGHCTQTSFLNWLHFFEEWKAEFWSFATRITFGTRKIWTNYSSCRPNRARLDPGCGRPGSLAAGMVIYNLLEPPFPSLFLKSQFLGNLVISPLCVRLSLVLVPWCRYLTWNTATWPGFLTRVCQNEVPVNLGSLSLALQTAPHAPCSSSLLCCYPDIFTGDTKCSTELFFSPGSTQNTEKWHDASQPRGHIPVKREWSLPVLLLAVGLTYNLSTTQIFILQRC